MDYNKMVKILRDSGIDTFNFKDFILFRNKQKSLELKVSREVFPRKNVTSEQCKHVLNLINKSF